METSNPNSQKLDQGFKRLVDLIKKVSKPKASARQRMIRVYEQQLPDAMNEITKGFQVDLAG